MPPEKAENLGWAAMQILQNYARCGVSMVGRGTDRWLQEFPDASADVSAARENRESQPSAVKPSAGLSSISPGAVPLPPMPLVALRSAAKTEKIASPQPVFSATSSLEIAEQQWLGPSRSEGERLELFAVLRQQVAECRKCEELACSRTQTVFGAGSSMPRVVFFGEAPGADEDRTGEPFVGAAGQLLNKIIQASQMRREDVYILNSLKCRPPGNRTPIDSEIENCRRFFEAQLDILQPEFIVCLGAVAVRAVLQTTESVGRLRGRFHRYRKAQVLVTYHPAYLLRNESAKKYVWDDMKLLMGAMGLKRPNAS